MTDRMILERHLAGDPAALVRILETHEAPLLRFARALLGSPDLAQDAVQETFLRFLREGPRVGEVQALFPWLLQVTRRVCWDMQRKEKRMDRKHEEARRQAAGTAVEAAEGPLVAGEVRDRVREAVARLPETQREVVRLRLWEGLSYQETADRLGLTLSNVSYHLGQAVKAVGGELRTCGILGQEAAR